MMCKNSQERGILEQPLKDDEWKCDAADEDIAWHRPWHQYKSQFCPRSGGVDGLGVKAWMASNPTANIRKAQLRAQVIS